MIAAAVIVTLSGAAWLYLRSSAPVSAPTAVSTPPAPQPPAVPPAAAAPAQPLPLLDASDEYAARRAQSLFAQPVPPPWLKAEGLIRRLTAAAVIVAEGDSPRDSLSFLKPRAKFKIKRAGGRVSLDPAGYKRYDAVGETAAALDAQAAARFLQQARPLFQQACAELNDKSCDIRDAVIRSAKILLKTPLVVGDVRLKEKVVTWAMTDPKLESLTPAQKHLIRLGPDNAQKVQGKLRELALALGASEAELPQPQRYQPAP